MIERESAILVGIAAGFTAAIITHGVLEETGVTEPSAQSSDIQAERTGEDIKNSDSKLPVDIGLALGIGYLVGRVSYKGALRSNGVDSEGSPDTHVVTESQPTANRYAGKITIKRNKLRRVPNAHEKTNLTIEEKMLFHDIVKNYRKNTR